MVQGTTGAGSLGPLRIDVTQEGVIGFWSIVWAGVLKEDVVTGSVLWLRGKVSLCQREAGIKVGAKYLNSLEASINSERVLKYHQTMRICLSLHLNPGQAKSQFFFCSLPPWSYIEYSHKIRAYSVNVVISPK